jgi:hypothetical protein
MLKEINERTAFLGSLNAVSAEPDAAVASSSSGHEYLENNERWSFT